MISYILRKHHAIYIILCIFWDEIFFQSDKIFISYRFIDKFCRIGKIWSYFDKKIIIFWRCFELYDSMSEFCLAIWIVIVNEKFLVGIVDKLLIFEIHIWIDTWIDESIVFYYWQRNVSDKYRSYQFRSLIFESFEIHIFQYLWYLMCF